MPHSDGGSSSSPFLLALYLSGMALGTTLSSRICGGHWVEPEVVPDLSFMRRQRPRYAEPDFSDPTLDDAMRGLSDAWEECHRIMASLVAVMRHLGMDHSPFPSANSLYHLLLSHTTLVMMVPVLQA
ncbi:unnamed protein product [Lactuca saligna]|uniref:Uncharacterized protein n=1 Tax=Lactuca saligna TaxID=75948 RepID=A0AA35V2L2_LACSI|nr:unnamed protein product [Lactuca saligna]